MNSKQALKAYEAGQRAATQFALNTARVYLAACDEIIVDIETAHVLGMSARTRVAYDDALEGRSRALQRLHCPPRPGSVVAFAADAQETARLALYALFGLICVEHILFPERQMRAPSAV